MKNIYCSCEMCVFQVFSQLVREGLNGWCVWTGNLSRTDFWLDLCVTPARALGNSLNNKWKKLYFIPLYTTSIGGKKIQHLNSFYFNYMSRIECFTWPKSLKSLFMVVIALLFEHKFSAAFPPLTADSLAPVHPGARSVSFQPPGFSCIRSCLDVLQCISRTQGHCQGCPLGWSVCGMSLCFCCISEDHCDTYSLQRLFQRLCWLSFKKD